MNNSINSIWCYLKNLLYLVQFKIITFLDENENINLHDLGNKRKIDKLNFIKIKKLFPSKGIVKEVKGK